jgi:YD repeat-containing protein
MKNRINKLLATATVLLGMLVGSVTFGATTTSYEYDVRGRLVKVTQGSAIVRYSYDAAGNRTRKEVQASAPTVINLGSATAVQQQGSVVLNVTVGSGSATGTVNFYEGGVFIGSAQLMNGTATVEFIGLSLGSHSITVSYSGDASHPSNSVTFPVNVVNLDWLPAVLQILLE